MRGLSKKGIPDHPGSIIRLIIGETVLCEGSNATFQLVSNPNLSNQTFNWLKNGNQTGNTDAIFQTNTLANNDQIVLQIETDEMCVASTTVTSNSLNIEVVSAIKPVVLLTVSKTLKKRRVVASNILPSTIT